MFNLYEKYLNCNSKRILILGGNGFLASRYRQWNELRENKLDFCSSLEIAENQEALLEKIKNADIVINTISETSVNSIRPDVIRKQLEINAEWPEALAKLSLELGFKLVHISTADLYDLGLKNDEYSPIKFSTGYYYSKSLGEQLIQNVTDKCLIIRPRLLFDDRNVAKNLITKLYKYDTLYRSIQSVSSTDLVVAASLYLSEINISGVINVCERTPVNYSDIGFDSENKKLILAESKIINVEKLKNTGFELKSKSFKKYYAEFK